MRKTTEELANAAVSELNDDAFDFNGLSASDKEMLLRWFETFRRLVIENERECAEKIGYIHPLDVGRSLNLTTEQVSNEQLPVYAGFPPAAQVLEVWALGTKTWMQLFATERDANEFQKGSAASTWIQPVKMHVISMLAAAPEVKHA
jgi:hypothetical protein